MDSKGRISIPVKYRHALSQLVIAPNPMPDEACLLIYPLPVWEKIEADFVSKPKTKQNRRMLRVFIGQAQEHTLDANSRLLLKPSFREFADLGKKVILVGQGNKLEIWNETAWNKLNGLSTTDADDQAAFIEELESMSY